MIVVTDTVERWVEPSEVRALFEGRLITIETDPVREMDEELGLPLVQKETIESKYGTPKLDPRNDFHNSLKAQFEKKGHLSPRQVSCLMNPKY